MKLTGNTYLERIYRGDLMGRELKRVPLDFDWPINKIWKGYDPSYSKDKISYWKNFPDDGHICLHCEERHKECDESKEYCIYYPKNREIWEYDPPDGGGFQLWETTSEGSPQTPVFKTLEELAEYCGNKENGITVFASIAATKEEWLKMFKKDYICYEEKYNGGSIIYL